MVNQKTLTEEINRINDLNKIIQEQDSNDNPFRSGRHGYWSGNKTYPINPNTDYLSDIGARKRKKKDDTLSTEKPTPFYLTTPFELNKDTIKIMYNRLLSGRFLGSNWIEKTDIFKNITTLVNGTEDKDTTWEAQHIGEPQPYINRYRKFKDNEIPTFEEFVDFFVKNKDEIQSQVYKYSKELRKMVDMIELRRKERFGGY